MRLLLIWPKARTDPEWGGDLGAIGEPLALEYLGAGAMLDGHQVKILDLRLQPDELAAELAAFAPDVVGITAYSMQVRAALAVAGEVKRWRATCRTVAGGHHATFLPEDFFEPAIDYVISGEGVAPLRLLLRRLDGATPGDPIPGLWRRDEAGVFGVEAAALPITAEGLPAPARELTRDVRHRYFIDWMTPVAFIRSSVGCPYKCSFCSLWKMTDGRYHRRNPDSFVEELRNIEEDFVFLVDDEAFINRRRMMTLAEMIRGAGLRKRFFAYARVDTILRQQDVLRAWRGIGLERLLVGIDGAFEKDLDVYNKGYHVPQIERALEVAQALGIEIIAQFVVNTDYTQKDFSRLVRFVEHHRIPYPSFTVLTPLPGTELLKSFDLVTVRQPNGRPDWDYFDTQNAVTATVLPPDEFRRAYRDLFRHFRGSYLRYRNQENLRAKSGHIVAASQAATVF
jgi:radical SAM superfamily enzyme YgiQ (UPF0313 family)